MITTPTLQLDSLNIQLDSSGALYGYINKQKLIDDLKSIESHQSGVIKFTCEKRRIPPRNGKPYSHMPPVVQASLITTPQEQSTE